jgi:S-adenosylmethionine decarboxylase
MIVGHHLILDSVVADTGILRDVGSLEVSFRRVFAYHGIKVLDFVSHAFPGHGGVTGVFLLAESHASFHTWPEHRLMCSDFFTCGNVDALSVSKMIRHEIACENIRVQVIPRGSGTQWRHVLPEPQREGTLSASSLRSSV